MLEPLDPSNRDGVLLFFCEGFDIAGVDFCCWEGVSVRTCFHQQSCDVSNEYLILMSIT